ncbi:hypothetical protein TTHERM_001034480 (macronuclear) [Tetrahymena thermophila SB210]|uniref:Uncharacterized protein n=1 Tax=Tetrahymena thermophila (strain SB210) TaxID=312017 RepID=W7X7K7_TETTS|nr:hypothetical protein TTHERM_001034480 [Tetrahymena thermophila SB210]EWS75345.1 hypothetical protein TTHERM_001034480 [Tetrahymena thermophila SB210]|eukprot:XP_012652134.1 hypothetical protein TTHERM_001034480 [Tetrahymena thermophila SB210]
MGEFIVRMKQNILFLFLQPLQFYHCLVFINISKIKNHQELSKLKSTKRKKIQFKNQSMRMIQLSYKEIFLQKNQSSQKMSQMKTIFFCSQLFNLRQQQHYYHSQKQEDKSKKG